LYGEGARLEEAAAAYRKAAADLRDPRVHLERLRLLVALGRWQELGEAARLAGDRRVDVAASGLMASEWKAAAPPWARAAGSERGLGLGEVFGAASALMSEGLEASSARAPAVRRAAALELAAGRHYQRAAELLAAQGDPLADRLARVERFQEMRPHEQDPLTPVLSVLVGLRAGPATSGALDRWIHEDLGREQREALLAAASTLLPEELAGIALSPDARADLGIGDLAVTRNGAPHLGYRLGAPQDRFFVTLRGDDLQLVALGSRPETLGSEALRRALAGDLPGAQKWLEWALEEKSQPAASGAADPLGFSPLRRLWPDSGVPKEGTLPPQTLRETSAALAASADARGEALAVLDEALAEESAGEPSSRRLALEVARLEALAGGSDFLQLESHAAQLLERYPESQRAFVRHLESLASLGWWSKLEEAARRWIDSGQPSPDARRVLAGLAVDRDAPDAAIAQLRAIDEGSEPGLSSSDAANLLLLLLREVQTSAAEAPGREAARLMESSRASGQDDARWLRARAAWLAHEGDVRAARERLSRAVTRAGGRLQLADAYVVGRLAETCGLPETARGLYRMLAEESARQSAPLMKPLAEKRLESLGAERASR
ncbi:MAG: hypothetical protein AAF725_23520, partial [Acidobacteriota bacterium]